MHEAMPPRRMAERSNNCAVHPLTQHDGHHRQQKAVQRIRIRPLRTEQGYRDEAGSGLTATRITYSSASRRGPQRAQFSDELCSPQDEVRPSSGLDIGLGVATGGYHRLPDLHP